MLQQENQGMVICYVTLPDKETANIMAHTLLDERLIACANILGEVVSIYDWEGRRAQESEVVMLLKTSCAKQETVMQRVAALHPYEIPCIVCVDVPQVYPSFAQWVIKATE